MKFIVFALMLVITLGLRHTHKSQYDLGYQAGLEAAMAENEEEGGLDGALHYIFLQHCYMCRSDPNYSDDCGGCP